MTHPHLDNERRGIAAEPLLPIEKKLIGWSFGIGVALLLILTLVNRWFAAA